MGANSSKFTLDLPSFTTENPISGELPESWAVHSLTKFLSNNKTPRLLKATVLSRSFSLSFKFTT
jgi:hypothetical protein